jgi:hypothetical protein
VLAANVAQILAELHRLAAANSRFSAAETRRSGVAPMLVIRGK